MVDRSHLLTAVVANPAGEIFDLEGYAAVGMKGGVLAPLDAGAVRPLPHGSELMFLPDRRPVALNLATGRIEMLESHPDNPAERLFPVSAFNSPGYVLTACCAYRPEDGAGMLPLFSYGALGWRHGQFHSAVFRVDAEPRQDLRQMPRRKVVAGIRKLRRQLPQNRLREHLENCALEYGCPAGKNFFLGRYEAPLPTARNCNARCLGCLSEQKGAAVPHCQDRISFTPTPEEISDVALAHIDRVPMAVVSFGQGCEGDPLLAAGVVEPAIARIRRATAEGTINLNTNGSLPPVLERLFDAGLDSIRISLNSVRPECYTAYFRPRKYRFEDVLRSIDMALERRKHVAINYLNCPGVTDSPEEVDALRAFLGRHPIDMIQWRNLNFDPLLYHHRMRRVAPLGSAVGVKNLIRNIEKEFPAVAHGYFNPPKERFGKKKAPVV
jgi:molybdenum cofactor biosynthesis enzyme MoaA